MLGRRNGQRSIGGNVFVRSEGRLHSDGVRVLVNRSFLGDLEH